MGSINLLVSAEQLFAQQKAKRIKLIKVLLVLFFAAWALSGFSLLVMFEAQGMGFKKTHAEILQVDGRYQQYLLEKKAAKAAALNLCNLNALQRVLHTTARGIGLYQLTATESITGEGLTTNDVSFQHLRQLLGEWVNVTSWEKDTRPERFAFSITGDALCDIDY